MRPHPLSGSPSGDRSYEIAPRRRGVWPMQHQVVRGALTLVAPLVVPAEDIAGRGPRLHPEFEVDLGQGVLDGLLGDAERVGGLRAARVVNADALEDFPLTVGQRLNAGHGASPFRRSF